MTGTPNGNNSDVLSERILAELRKMNKVMALVNGDKLESQLAKYATTPERKKAWALMDGTKDVDDLIGASGLKRRSVYDFITALEKAGLVETTRGQPPTRGVDFVPADWVELLKTAQTSSGDQPATDVARQTGPANLGGDNNGQ
jgi:hypothetical protein